MVNLTKRAGEMPLIYDIMLRRRAKEDGVCVWKMIGTLGVLITEQPARIAKKSAI